MLLVFSNRQTDRQTDRKADRQSGLESRARVKRYVFTKLQKKITDQKFIDELIHRNSTKKKNGMFPSELHYEKMSAKISCWSASNMSDKSCKHSSKVSSLISILSVGAKSGRTGFEGFSRLTFSIRMVEGVSSDEDDDVDGGVGGLGGLAKGPVWSRSWICIMRRVKSMGS